MLKGLKKVTRNPHLWIGMDSKKKWRIKKEDGKLYSYRCEHESEARFVAIEIAMTGMQWNSDAKRFRMDHREKLYTFEMLQRDYM